MQHSNNQEGTSNLWDISFHHWNNFLLKKTDGTKILPLTRKHTKALGLRGTIKLLTVNPSHFTIFMLGFLFMLLGGVNVFTLSVPAIVWMIVC